MDPSPAFQSCLKSVVQALTAGGQSTYARDAEVADADTDTDLDGDAGMDADGGMKMQRRKSSLPTLLEKGSERALRERRSQRSKGRKMGK